jgi:hypothetical protein
VLLLQNHLEFQVVTPRTLSGFRGDTLVLPDVSELSDSERKSLQDFLTRSGRLVITGAEPPSLPPSERITRFEVSPGTTHLQALEKDFSAASQHMPAQFLTALAPNQDVTVTAPPFIASNTAQVNGQTHVFLANFAGLVPHHNSKPSTENSVRLTVPASCKCVLHFLPFLGEEQTVASASIGNKQVYSLPAFDRAAVAWLAKK